MSNTILRQWGLQPFIQHQNKNMKKALFIICFLFYGQAFSQGMFGKNPYRNQQDWDQQRVHYGYFVGFSSYNFKYDYSEKSLTDCGDDGILVQFSVGFNVGMVGNLRLIDYLDLRFEPGLYYITRTVTFLHIVSPDLRTRDVASTHIDFPLLLKFA